MERAGFLPFVPQGHRTVQPHRYDASGKPTGSYYAHAKGAQMPEFAEWANAKLAAI